MRSGGGRTVFALWLDFDQDLALRHDLDDFADIASWFVQKLEFFSEQPHPGVESISLSFQTSKVLGFLVDGELRYLNFGLIIGFYATGL